jgi:FlgD Ig-like domain
MRFRPHLALAALLLAGATVFTAPSAIATPLIAVALTDSTGNLPYVDFIRFCGVNHCDPPGQTICPQDSLVFQIGGRFPNACFSFDRIEFLPIPLGGPIGPSLALLVVVNHDTCSTTSCPDSEVPWSAQLVTAPFPPGRHTANIALGVTECSDSVITRMQDVQPPPAMTTAVFTVSDQCETPPSQTCLVGRWEHLGLSSDLCDASVSEGHPAHVTFQLNSTVPLAGLQGTFQLDPHKLKITNVETTGAAEGMSVQCTFTSTGAKFVLFSTSGATIPASPPGQDPVSVLRLTVASPTVHTITNGGDDGDDDDQGDDDHGGKDKDKDKGKDKDKDKEPKIPRLTLVTANSLLGSDANGGAVNPCPFRDDKVRIDAARICSQTACDLNHDGRADVRDLVLMINCLNGVSCVDSSGFDCDNSGSFTLDDVMCCGRKILGNPCNDCPPDTTPPQKDMNVHVALGAAVEMGDVLEVPLTISGCDRLAGARVALNFPSDRYDVKAIASQGSTGGGWLLFSQVAGGTANVGLIDAGGPYPMSAEAKSMTVVLRLSPKSGKATGGQVTLGSSDFSNSLGNRLQVDLKSTPTSLPGQPPSFALSENQPNPFTGETRFTLTLPQAANVDLGVFDIAGRRIATLNRGPLGAGIQPFAWSGKLDGGGQAKSGVYFYRATIEGRTIARRMVLLASF